ncbi:MAG: lyase, partial [Gemmatimonadota bacterium]|nr:lyase [Gemmatimonadota bacterium]
MMLTVLALIVPLIGSEGDTLTVAAVEPVQITEWQVPWADSRPRDPYVDAQGRVWFVGQRSDYVAYLEPSSG